MKDRTKTHLAVNGNDAIFKAKDGLTSACGTTTFPDNTPKHTKDVKAVTCQSCLTAVAQGRVPGLRTVILLVLGCGRIYLSGQIHDPHIHHVSGEYVYCAGAANASI